MSELHEPAAAVRLEVGRGVAGVGGHREHGRARLREAALQLGGEQQVGQLGLAVGRPAAVPPALPVEVVEVDPAGAVGAGGDRDDPSRDVRQQEVREGEVAEVVGAELQLEAVAVRDSGGIMTPALLMSRSTGRRPVAGERADRVEAGQVEEADLGRARSRQGAGGLGSPGLVADREDHPGAVGGEGPRRLQADAAAARRSR